MKWLALVVKPFNERKRKSHATFPQSQISDNLSQLHIHPWGKNDRKNTSAMINIKWPCYTVCQICHEHWFPDRYALTLQEYSKTEDNLSTGALRPYLHFFYLILQPKSQVQGRSQEEETYKSLYPQHYSQPAWEQIHLQPWQVISHKAQHWNDSIWQSERWRTAGPCGKRQLRHLISRISHAVPVLLAKRLLRSFNKRQAAQINVYWGRDG